MIILVCPGVHPPQLTQSFLLNFPSNNFVWLVFPAPEYPPYSPLAILKFWEESIGKKKTPEPILLIGFSAGVVGAMGTALALSYQGMTIKALIAIDGWGVPLGANFPIHRVSHDYFTHWSSALLGAGEDSFYVEPAVEHLDLWRQPHTARGWWVKPSGNKVSLTAAEFIWNLLEWYQ